MEDIKELEKFEKTRGKLKLPPDLKPCIASLLDSPNAKDGINPFIIACELHRVGRSNEKIEAILLRLGVTPSKARSAIQSAATGNYSYGCPRLEEFGLCLEKTRFQCWWHEKIPRQSQKDWTEWDFWRYEWPQRIHPTDSMIYLAIRFIRRKRRIRAESWVFISWDELIRTSGVSRPTIKKSLARLQKVGLIEYKTGQKRGLGSKGLAIQIRRIIPIPRP